MRNYTVTMPLCGAICLNVEAETEEQAIEKFRDEMDKVSVFNWQEMNKAGAEIVEWDFYEKMISGNVRHFRHNEVEVEEYL